MILQTGEKILLAIAVVLRSIILLLRNIEKGSAIFYITQ